MCARSFQSYTLPSFLNFALNLRLASVDMIFYTTHHSSSIRYLLHAEVVYLVVVKYKETVVLLKTFFWSSKKCKTTCLTGLLNFKYKKLYEVFLGNLGQVKKHIVLVF